MRRCLSEHALRKLVEEAGGVRHLERKAGLGHRTLGNGLDTGCTGMRISTFLAVADACEIRDLNVLFEGTERDGEGVADLRAALKQAGLTQAEAARLADIPKSTLSMAVSGTHRLGPLQDGRLVALLAERGVELAARARGRATFTARNAHRRRKLETAMREPLRPEVREAFGLNAEPFATVDWSADALFRTRDYALAYEQLLAAAEAKEFVILCGPVGVGKTHTLHAVLADLMTRERFLFCRVHATETARLTVPAISEAILSEFAVERIPMRMERRARLVQATLEHSDREERSAVIVVDEAHDLSVPILKQLKRFHEMVSRTRFRPILGIILCGQLPLEHKLRRNLSLREVTWRASCVRLEGLRGQVRDYLKFRLWRVGGSIAAFDPGATDELERHTVVPLEANVIAAKAMTLAHKLIAVRGKAVVRAEDIREAAKKVL